MALDLEQIKYMERLIDTKERTAQPLERIFIHDLRNDLEKMKRQTKKENSSKMVCKHAEIVIGNMPGGQLERGSYEIDFVIRCHACDEELFRISEYKRQIHNLSKH